MQKKELGKDCNMIIISNDYIESWQRMYYPPLFEDFIKRNCYGVNVRKMMNTANLCSLAAGMPPGDVDEEVNDIIARINVQTVNTKFGGFLENFAEDVIIAFYGGRKSLIEGAIDLEFMRALIQYYVAVKSGANWANDAALSDLTRYFKSKKRVGNTSCSPGRKKQEVACIELCLANGTSNGVDKGEYLKYSGRHAWTWLSDGDTTFFKRFYMILHEKISPEYGRMRFPAGARPQLKDKILELYCGGKEANIFDNAEPKFDFEEAFFPESKAHKKFVKKNNSKNLDSSDIKDVFE